MEFKNIAIRDYPSWNLDRVKSIKNHLDDLTAYKKEILNYQHRK